MPSNADPKYASFVDNNVNDDEHGINYLHENKKGSAFRLAFFYPGADENESRFSLVPGLEECPFTHYLGEESFTNRKRAERSMLWNDWYYLLI